MRLHQVPCLIYLIEILTLVNHGLFYFLVQKQDVFDFHRQIVLIRKVICQHDTWPDTNRRNDQMVDD